jgi:vacuolar-type H+-ATPase subunit E/Vma4
VPLDALLATLEREAVAETERLVAEARARAAAVTAEADASGARRRAEVLARREAEQQAALQRNLAGARREARATVLAARERLLAQLFAAVRAALPAAAAGSGYRDALPADLERALTFVGARPVVARCAPALASELARLAKANGRLTISPDPTIAAGFRLVTTDGALEVDGTLEGRVERLRPRLALAALAELGTQP